MRNESPRFEACRCRKGSAEHCGDPLPLFLASNRPQLGNVIFVPRSFTFGHPKSEIYQKFPHCVAARKSPADDGGEFACSTAIPIVTAQSRLG